MKKGILIFIILLSAALRIYSQEYIIKNVESERFNQILSLELFLKGGDTSLLYFKDNNFNSRRTLNFLKQNQDFSASSTSTNLFLSYLNPLQYEVSIGVEEKKDEEMENAVNNLISGFGSMLTFISTSVPTSAAQFQTPSGLPKQASVLYAQFVSPFSNDVKLEFASKDATELYLWLNSPQFNFPTVITDTNKRNKFLELLSNVDTSLFSNSDTQKMKGIYDKMKELDSYIKLSAQINDIKSEIIKLEESKKGLEDNIVKMTAENFDWIKDSPKFYKKFAKGHQKIVVENYTKALALRTINIQNLSKLHKLLSDFKNNSIWDGESYLLKNIDVNRSAFYDVTINVKQREFDENFVPKKSIKVISRTFRIKRIRKIIIAYGGGIMYTTVSYKQFGVGVDNSTQKDVVKELANEEKTRFTIGPCLNFIPNIMNTYLLPFLQIGAAPAKEYPMFLAGLGLNLPDYNVSISGGAVFTWQRKLKDGIAVGQEFTGTSDDIKNNIEWQFDPSPKFYLNLSFNFERK